MRTKQRIVCISAESLLVLLAALIAILAQDSEKPTELKVLDRYVGTWLHEVTVLPSKTAASSCRLRN